MITKDIIISIEIIKKPNLQSKSIQKGLGMTKVMFLLSMAPPQCPVTREKNAIYNKKLGFLHYQISASVPDCT
jgi:hypothetical protein